MNIPVIPRYKIVVVPASCFRYISVFTVVHHERNQSKHVGEPHESKSNQPYLFETHKTNRVDPILEYSKTDEIRNLKERQRAIVIHVFRATKQSHWKITSNKISACTVRAVLYHTISYRIEYSWS